MKKKSKIITCKNCNSPMDRNEKFCNSCGVKNNQYIYRKWWILLIVILILAVIGSLGSSSSGRKSERIYWDKLTLGQMLPKPVKEKGSIIVDSLDNLNVNIDNISSGDYKKYISECESMGYNIESEQDSNSYSAFDKNGYGLRVSYISDSMSIDLEAPMKMQEISWPKSELAGLVPQTNSKTGKISTDSEDSFFIYVGETSKDEFNAYVDKCVENGFKVDYNRGQDFYNANDSKGNYLSVRYLGNKIICIEAKKSEDNNKENEKNTQDEQSQQIEKPLEQDNNSQKNTQSSNQTVNSDGMRAEFKTAMDSYEKFMNEYCDFMNKYSQSDGTDVGLLADYAKYMAKYAKFVKDFEEWDSKEMNSVETAYYLDVQTRINKKLLEIAK